MADSKNLLVTTHFLNWFQKRLQAERGGLRDVAENENYLNIDRLNEKHYDAMNVFKTFNVNFENEEKRIQFVICFYFLYVLGFRPGKSRENPDYVGCINLCKSNLFPEVKTGKPFIRFDFQEKQNDRYQLTHEVLENIFKGIQYVMETGDSIRLFNLFCNETGDSNGDFEIDRFTSN